MNADSFTELIFQWLCFILDFIGFFIIFYFVVFGEKQFASAIDDKISFIFISNMDGYLNIFGQIWFWKIIIFESSALFGMLSFVIYAVLLDFPNFWRNNHLLVVLCIMVGVLICFTPILPIVFIFLIEFVTFLFFYFTNRFGNVCHTLTEYHLRQVMLDFMHGQYPLQYKIAHRKNFRIEEKEEKDIVDGGSECDGNQDGGNASVADLEQDPQTMRAIVVNYVMADVSNASAQNHIKFVEYLNGMKEKKILSSIKMSDFYPNCFKPREKYFQHIRKAMNDYQKSGCMKYFVMVGFQCFLLLMAVPFYLVAKLIAICYPFMILVMCCVYAFTLVNIIQWFLLVSYVILVVVVGFWHRLIVKRFTSAVNYICPGCQSVRFNDDSTPRELWKQLRLTLNEIEWSPIIADILYDFFGIDVGSIVFFYFTHMMDIEEIQDIDDEGKESGEPGDISGVGRRLSAINLFSS